MAGLEMVLPPRLVRQTMLQRESEANRVLESEAPGSTTRCRRRCPPVRRRGSCPPPSRSPRSGWCRGHRSGCRRGREPSGDRRRCSGRRRPDRVTSRRPPRCRSVRCRTGRPGTGVLNPLSAVKNGQPGKIGPVRRIERVFVLAQGGRDHAVDAAQHAHRRGGLDPVRAVQVGRPALPQQLSGVAEGVVPTRCRAEPHCRCRRRRFRSRNRWAWRTASSRWGRRRGPAIRRGPIRWTGGRPTRCRPGHPPRRRDRHRPGWRPRGSSGRWGSGRPEGSAARRGRRAGRRGPRRPRPGPNRRSRGTPEHHEGDDRPDDERRAVPRAGPARAPAGLGVPTDRCPCP